MILENIGILSNTTVADPNANAAAYIALIEAAGATVTDPQKTIISEFYRDAENAGYYSSLKRLYLPIWGVAAANAIDMIGGTSGTFNGGVTHGAGYVATNGTTGYFDMGVSPATAGLGNNDASLLVLVAQASATTTGSTLVGSKGASISDNSSIFANSTTIFSRIHNFLATGTATRSVNNVDQGGVLIGSRISSANNTLHIRKTSGFTSNTNSSTNTTTASPTNTYALAFNNNGVVESFCLSDLFLGAYGLGLGLTSDQASSYSLHLKNLWQSLTGLTLP